MFGKPKPFSSPSDAQANEKLALYVYEYLVYSGAQKAAQTFLQEIGWEKHIVPNEAPGFLFSWWSVFWDLYCAAPERRDVLKHSPDARAFYDYGLANPGFASGGPQSRNAFTSIFFGSRNQSRMAVPKTKPTLMAGPGLHYVQGRNGPPPMIQHQQYITQPRQMLPPGIARSSDVKIPGLMPMGEQHLEAFLSSPSAAAAAAAAAFRPNSNIPSLPIASAPTVTLRHQPRPIGPRGPLMTNGGAVAPLNSSSSTASSSFSGSSSNGDFQPGMHQHQFGRSHPFQQRSLPLKMSPCTPNGMLPSQQQPQWSPGLGHPVDFLGNPQSTSKMSPDVGTTTTPMIFDAALLDSLPPAPQPQPPTSSSGGGSGSTGDGFAFFDQTDALPVEDVVVSSGQPQQQLQPPQISSQISQLLSPSPLQQGSRQEAPRPKTTIIDEALLLGAPELEILTGSDDPTGVVEASEQSISRPHPPPAVQIFDSEQMKNAETQAILFPSSDDLRTVQNLVDAMHDPTSNDLLPPASSIQKPFCPLKDIETSATLFLQE